MHSRRETKMQTSETLLLTYQPVKACTKCGSVEFDPSGACTPCHKISNTKTNPVNNPRNNPQRMFVNGRYIPKSNPLHKPGRFKGGIGDAWSNVELDEKIVAGYVYLIVNRAFPGWIKVGMAVDVDDRLGA